MLGLGLRVDYGTLADNLLRTEASYSFLEDEHNPFVIHKNNLGNAILSDPKLRKQFVVEGSLNVMAGWQWLVDLAELESYVMLSADMKCGAAECATELVSMLMFNTRLWLRNCMALGSHLGIVRQYDKTTNMTQSNRLIPHSVDALDSDIIIQIHGLARPFAQVS